MRFSRWAVRFWLAARRVGPLLPACVAPGVLAPPARAEPFTTVWTTYFHAGPSTHAPVLDEVEPGTTVDVYACRDGWCLVRYGEARGYVPNEVFGLRNSPLDPYYPRVSSGKDCFSSLQPTRNALRENEFCPEGSHGPPATPEVGNEAGSPNVAPARP